MQVSGGILCFFLCLKIIYEHWKQAGVPEVVLKHGDGSIMILVAQKPALTQISNKVKKDKYTYTIKIQTTVPKALKVSKKKQNVIIYTLNQLQETSTLCLLRHLPHLSAVLMHTTVL